MLRHHCKRHILTHCRRHVAADATVPIAYKSYQIILKISQQHRNNSGHSKTYDNSNSLHDLTQILQYNQKFNHRITFNLELYHKNILKKLYTIRKDTFLKLQKKIKQKKSDKQMLFK